MAWVLLAFTLGLLVGEEVRDVLYGSAPAAPATGRRAAPPKPVPETWQEVEIVFGFVHLAQTKGDVEPGASGKHHAPCARTIQSDGATSCPNLCLKFRYKGLNYETKCDINPSYSWSRWL